MPFFIKDENSKKMHFIRLYFLKILPRNAHMPMKLCKYLCGCWKLIKFNISKAKISEISNPRKQTKSLWDWNLVIRDFAIRNYNFRDFVPNQIYKVTQESMTFLQLYIGAFMHIGKVDTPGWFLECRRGHNNKAVKIFVRDS